MKNCHSKKLLLSLEETQVILFEMLKDIGYICEKHNIQYWLDFGTLLGAIRHEGFIPWDDDIDLGMMRDDYNKFFEIIKVELPKHMELIHYSIDKKNTYFIKLKYKKSLAYNDKGIDIKSGISIDIFPKDSIDYRYFFIYNMLRKIFSISINFHENENEIKFKIKKIIVNLTNASRSNIYSIINYFFYNKNNSSVIVCGLEFGYSKLISNFFIKKNQIFPLQKKIFEKHPFPVPLNFHKYLTLLYSDYMEIPKDKSSHNLKFMLEINDENLNIFNYYRDENN